MARLSSHAINQIRKLIVSRVITAGSVVNIEDMWRSMPKFCCTMWKYVSIVLCSSRKNGNVCYLWPTSLRKRCSYSWSAEYSTWQPFWSSSQVSIFPFTNKLEYCRAVLKGESGFKIGNFRDGSYTNRAGWIWPSFLLIPYITWHFSYLEKC